ncbi:hypothetical protein D3C73_1040570 [compost metagenome]
MEEASFSMNRSVDADKSLLSNFRAPLRSGKVRFTDCVLVIFSLAIRMSSFFHGKRWRDIKL